jgi:hypothetical protein
LPRSFPSTTTAFFPSSLRPRGRSVQKYHAGRARSSIGRCIFSYFRYNDLHFVPPCHRRGALMASPGELGRRAMARFSVSRATLTRHSCRETRHPGASDASPEASEASVSGVKLHETNPSEPQRNLDASPDVTTNPSCRGTPPSGQALGSGRSLAHRAWRCGHPAGETERTRATQGNKRCEPPRELQNEPEGEPPGAPERTRPASGQDRPLSAGTAS